MKQNKTRVITDEIFRKVIFDMYITHSIINELIKMCFMSMYSILTEIQFASLASLKMLESLLYVQIML